ncbi:MAG: TIGR03905 family TSCPD domain-containing protein [Rikenellaceae bacterium]|nr:TIGR03905 family TSCPD domain-containing protein [Rikenellaceae bacterium]
MEKINYTLIPSPIVCTTLIEVEISGDTVSHVSFTHGCNGNAKAIDALVRGMKAEDVIRRLSGVECKDKGTSCADQLAVCLKKALESRAKWSANQK